MAKRPNSTDPALVEAALHDLIATIEAGGEYPDASWAVAQKWGVDYERLRMKYDAIYGSEEEGFL